MDVPFFLAPVVHNAAVHFCQTILPPSNQQCFCNLHLFKYRKMRPEMGAPGLKEDFKAFEMDTPGESANLMP